MKAVRILTVHSPFLQGCMSEANFYLRQFIEIPLPKEFENRDINDITFGYELTAYLEHSIDTSVHRLEILDVPEDYFGERYKKDDVQYEYNELKYNVELK